jgi:hypothetical protein
MPTKVLRMTIRGNFVLSVSSFQKTTSYREVGKNCEDGTMPPQSREDKNQPHPIEEPSEMEATRKKDKKTKNMEPPPSPRAKSKESKGKKGKSKECDDIQSSNQVSLSDPSRYIVLENPAPSGRFDKSEKARKARMLGSVEEDKKSDSPGRAALKLTEKSMGEERGRKKEREKKQVRSAHAPPELMRLSAMRGTSLDDDDAGGNNTTRSIPWKEHNNTLGMCFDDSNCDSSSSSKSLSSKDTTLVKSEDEEKRDDVQRKKCLMWFSRMGQPNRTNMKRRVADLHHSCDITVGDVDLLPWTGSDKMMRLSVKDMQKLLLTPDVKTVEKATVVVSREEDKKSGSPQRTASTPINRSSKEDGRKADRARPKVRSSEPSESMRPSAMRGSSCDDDDDSDDVGDNTARFILKDRKKAAPESMRPSATQEMSFDDDDDEASSSSKESKSSLSKDTTPVESEDEEKRDDVQRKKCLMWFSRMGQPNRTNMKRRVADLHHSCDITVGDVDLLPWTGSGEMLSVKAMNKLFMAPNAKTAENTTAISSMEKAKKIGSPKRRASILRTSSMRGTSFEDDTDDASNSASLSPMRKRSPPSEAMRSMRPSTMRGTSFDDDGDHPGDTPARSSPTRKQRSQPVTLRPSKMRGSPWDDDVDSIAIPKKAFRHHKERSPQRESMRPSKTRGKSFDGDDDGSSIALSSPKKALSSSSSSSSSKDTAPVIPNRSFRYRKDRSPQRESMRPSKTRGMSFDDDSNDDDGSSIAHSSPKKELLSSSSKDTAPVKLEDEEKKKNCLMWYSRMGQPNRTNMKRRVADLDQSCNITAEDVDLLPWTGSGMMLRVKDTNKLMLGP